MPPAISDDEASDSGDAMVALPKRDKKPVSYKEVEKIDDEDPAENGDAGDAGDDDEEGDEDELEEDEFIVEKILGHRIEEDGTIRYKVKWEGWEKKADQTWEPEENLKENASSILDEYLESIGGRDRIFEETADAKKSKKRGRPSAGNASAGATKRSRKEHPRSMSPPAAAVAAEWKPPAGSWEDLVATLDAAQDEKTGQLVIYLDWKDGHRTKHNTEVIYKRCPIKMLRFYERHVRIVKQEAPTSTEAETT